jgi:peptidyl-prolyl cis-trans isomerase B (cyclophilin B)
MRRFLLALLVCSTALSAQDSGAKLMIELESALPRLQNTQGAGQGMPNFNVNWEKSISKLGDIATRAAGTRAEPWALYHLANALYSAGNIEEAASTFRDLSERFATHPLNTVPLEKGGKSRLARALDDCVQELAFRSKHTVKDLPRAEVDTALSATLHFSAGDVTFGFYSSATPAHVKNFLDLAQSGFYDRTRVHHIAPGQWVKLGDPNSRDKYMDEWGKGGPAHSLDNEFSRATHKRGSVSMWRGSGRPKSHGSQFMVLLADQPHLDFVQTPFAEVIAGLDILEQVSRKTRNQFECPAEEVWLNGITINRKPAK